MDLSDITFVIKTFERPQCLLRLLSSLLKQYPNVPTIIVDDSKNINFNIRVPKHVRYFKLPFDVGLSAGRNFALNKVETKYFVLLDDDFLFDNHITKNCLENLKQGIVEHDLDICGGRVYDTDRQTFLSYYANLSVEDKILKQTSIKTDKDNNHYTCDLILNFFIADTKKVLDMGGWDPELKVAEHTDFFLKCKRAKLKTGFILDATILHQKQLPQQYAPFRKRGPQFTKIMLEKNGFDAMIDVNERTIPK